MALLITGPSGAGKSTVSRQLATELGKCVDIDIEHINFMIVDGFYPQTNKEGEDVTFTKWELTGTTIGLLARHFLDSGYQVIVHGHVTLTLLENIEKHAALTHKFLLLPTIETAIKRDNKRGNRMMGADMVKEHYRYFVENNFDGFIRLDSTDETMSQTVEKFRGMIETKI